MATAIITDKKPSTKSVDHIDYAKINLIGNKRVTLINEVLPFRIRITNIGIDAYGPNNPAPIGIAIIGLNNYVM
jgi:hypothetical protein|tara:strand:+ start:211 stop:432 length:222 start_codon:yes stop_codon:yes gene_type:complete